MLNFFGAAGRGIDAGTKAVGHPVVRDAEDATLFPHLKVLSWGLNEETGCLEWNVALLHAKSPLENEMYALKPGNCISLYNKKLSASSLHSWEIDAADIASGHKIIKQSASKDGSFFGFSQQQLADSDWRDYKFWLVGHPAAFDSSIRLYSSSSRIPSLGFSASLGSTLMQPVGCDAFTGADTLVEDEKNPRRTALGMATDAAVVGASYVARPALYVAGGALKLTGWGAGKLLETGVGAIAGEGAQEKMQQVDEYVGKFGEMAIDGAIDYGTVAIAKGTDVAASVLTAGSVSLDAYANPKIDEIVKRYA